MKKCVPVLAVLLLSYGLSAQYKKASFFSKSGRTYEFGTQLNALGKGMGSPIGFKIGFGGDRDGKQFFSSWELQLIPSYKYSYVTTDETDAPALISGTTKATLVYAVHYCYHLLKNDDDKRMVKPYVTAGLVFTFTGGIKNETQTPESLYNLGEQTADQAFNVGLGGGAGTLINFSPKLGLNLQGGYNYIFNFNSDLTGYGIKPYYLFPPHAYVSLTLRIRIVTDN